LWDESAVGNFYCVQGATVIFDVKNKGTHHFHINAAVDTTNMIMIKWR